MPILQEIFLIPQSGLSEDLIYDNWQDLQKQNYLALCPRLQSLTSHFALIVPTRTMADLQHLSFSMRTPDSDTPLWLALAMTPKLKALDVYFPSYWSWKLRPAPPEGVRSLLALRRIGAYGYPSSMDFDWINYLRTPQLDTLAVALEHRETFIVLFRILRRQVRHLIISTVENPFGGYYYYRDVDFLQLLETVEVLELRDHRPHMLSRTDQSFFKSMLRTCTDDPTSFSARITRLVIRDSCLHLPACKSLAKFVKFRDEAAAKNGGTPFAFTLINSTIKKRDGEHPPEFLQHFQKYISDSLIDSESVSGDSEQYEEEGDDDDKDDIGEEDM
ncbi:hypothetical protein BKA62DRAFT_709654, partial [Auriculariales sp. MPI-PUGE-AT-0066]